MRIIREWTGEEINKIADLLLTREYGAKEIAEIVGRSKNSIMGVIWRTAKLKEIGLPNKNRIIKPIKSEPESESEPEMELPPMSKPEPIIEVVETGPRPLMELKDTHCKFPLWGHYDKPKMNEMLFCCKPILSGTPYCEEHCKLCFAPPANKSVRPIRFKQVA